MRVFSALLIALLLGVPDTRAASTVYTTLLTPETSGATGSGTATVTYDDVAQSLNIQTSFSGLSGTTTVAHIHCCVIPPGAVGVAVTPGTLPGFPTGVSALNNYMVDIDLTNTASYTTGFLSSGGGTAAGAEAALIAGIEAGRAYLNIHTTTFGGGEIRGFLAEIPEPQTIFLLLCGLPALGATVRRGRVRR